MPDDSNLDHVMGQLKQFINSFDFTRPGIEGSMGKDAAHAVAERIAEAAADQKTTDGEPFPDNAPEYAAWKDEKYGVGPNAYGRRTGQMLSLESLLGEVEVSGGEVTIRYGTGQAPTRSSASGYISESDKSTTDIEKAFFITNQGKRLTFYKAGAAGREAVVEVLKEAVARAIQEENGG